MKLTLKTFLFSVIFASLMLEQVVLADQPFELFNGKDLEGWQGRDDLWSVVDGAITGRTTDENPINENTFLISTHSVGNFDLTFKYRIENGNSGVQYRSEVLDEAKFVVGGYQADIDSQPRYSGINYEEKKRGILADRGQITVLRGDAKPDVIGLCGDSVALQDNIKPQQWNDYRVLAIDNQMRHFINGVLMSEVIDLSGSGSQSGVLALQLHRGPAMVVQFKDFKLVELSSESKSAN